MCTKTNMPRGTKRFGFDDTIYPLASSVVFFTCMIATGSTILSCRSLIFSSWKGGFIFVYRLSEHLFARAIFAGAACCVGVWRVGGQ